MTKTPNDQPAAAPAHCIIGEGGHPPDPTAEPGSAENPFSLSVTDTRRLQIALDYLLTQVPEKADDPVFAEAHNTMTGKGGTGPTMQAAFSVRHLLELYRALRALYASLTPGQRGLGLLRLYIHQRADNLPSSEEEIAALPELATRLLAPLGVPAGVVQKDFDALRAKLTAAWAAADA